MFAQEENITSKLTEQQQKEKEEYLQTALQNYDEILRDQEKELQPNPSHPIQKDFYCPSDDLTVEQRKKQNEYWTEALNNYDGILERAAMAGDHTKKLLKDSPIPEVKTNEDRQHLSPEQKQIQSSYLEEALKNYEELLDQEMKKEKDNQQKKEKAREEWKAKQKDLLQQYYQEALKNYEEILENERLGQRP